MQNNCQQKMLEPFAEFIRFHYDYYHAHYYILLGRGQRTSGTALLEGRTRKNTKYKTKTQRNYKKHCDVRTNQSRVCVHTVKIFNQFLKYPERA